MDEYLEYSPETFIQLVLKKYLVERQTTAHIAKWFNADEVLVIRIIKQYYDLKTAPIAFIEEKKKTIKELKDRVRKDNEKITLDDIKDLQIDLGLFGQGKEPDTDKENDKCQ